MTTVTILAVFALIISIYSVYNGVSNERFGAFKYNIHDRVHNLEEWRQKSEVLMRKYELIFDPALREHRRKNFYQSKPFEPFTKVPTRQEHLEVIASWMTNLINFCHGDAVAAGWYTNLDTGERKQLNVGERMALIHSEISEAFEAYRKNLMDDHLPDRKGIEVELADAVIRIMDFAGAEKLDLGGAIIDKLEYNRNRADHKIEARKGENGKKC